MKKTLKIIGIILLILILILAGLTIWKWDVIKSVYKGLNSTPDEISKQIDDSQSSIQQNIEELTGLVFRELSEEEQKLIAEGKMSQSEVFEKILNETIEEYLSNHKAETIEKKDYDSIVAQYTGSFYALKGKYSQMLESLIGQADAEFHSLPREQWTVSNRTKIISKYIGVATGYEAQCDSEVSALLSSMKKELKSIGADTAIVDKMQEAYYEEKSLKISYYASQMK